MYDCMVEGDSSTVISGADGKAVGLWQFLHGIWEVRNLMRIVQAVLVHIPHSKNDAAEKLAKWEVGQEDDFVGNHIPECSLVASLF